MGDPDPFSRIEDSRALAQAIVDTIREPLLVLDKDLRVVAASRSFFLTFGMSRQDVREPARSTPSATATGTSRSYACCWNASCRSTRSWTAMRSSRNSRSSAGATWC